MCICAGRLAVYTVVSTHHGGSPRFHDSRTKSRPVRLTHIAFACSRVKTMALGLWTRMNCVVLGSGNNFQVLRIVTLESLDECHTKTAGKIRIFSICLLPASPAGVAGRRHMEKIRILPAVLVWHSSRDSRVTIRST